MTSSASYNLSFTQIADDAKVPIAHDYPQSFPILQNTLRVRRAFYLDWDAANSEESIHTMIVTYVAAQKLSSGH